MNSWKMADDEFNVTVIAEKEVKVLSNVTVKETDLVETEMTSLVHNASEDSEYETLEEDNGIDEELDDEDRSFGSQRSSPLEDGEVTDGESVIIEDERVEGDGEEQESEPTKDRKLDDDEDRRNPQYIPKKGTFYEHDDRTLLEDGEDVEGDENSVGEKTKEVGQGDSAITLSSNVNIKEAADDVKQKRAPGGAPGSKTKAGGKVWMDKSNDTWQHDLYVEDDQKPKSTQELIDTYGYDIRNEEAPPKARRRRRYGRGPNKYTRNWEDEDAYRPSAVIIVGGRGSARGRGGNRGRGRPVRSGRDLLPASNSNDQQDVTTNLVSQAEFPKLTDHMPRRSPIKPTHSHSKYPSTSNSTVNVSVRKITNNFSTRAKSNDRNQNYNSTKRHSDEHSSSASIPAIHSKQINAKDSFPGSKFSPLGLPRNFRGRGHTKEDAVINEKGDAERLVSKYTTLMDFASSGRGRGRLPPAAFSSHKRHPLAPASSPDVNPVVSITQKLNQFEISSSYTPSNEDEVKKSAVTPTPLSKDVIQSGALERRVQEVPPRMQETNIERSTNVGRSKRYSAQRQRSLPETTYSPPPSTQSQPPVSTAAPQPATASQQQPTQHQIPYYPPPPPAQTISVPDYPPPPVFNESVSVAGPPPQIVAFIPPGPPPPPGTAPPFPPPPIINYVPTPAPYHALPFQPPAVQQAELFQGQNGTTYYSTQTQVALQRPTPPRRVKLAIPIVPPPNDQSARGRGRNAEQDAKA